MDHISIPFSKLSVAPAAQASAQPVETIAPADLAPAAQAPARKPPPVLAEDGTDITALVALICDGNDAQKQYAAGALGVLAQNYDNRILIAQAGGIPPLVALICDGNDEQKHFAAAALENLAVNDNQILIAQAKREAGI